QALGTAIGAGLVLAVGVIVGVLESVPLTTVLAAAVLLLGIVIVGLVLNAYIATRIEVLPPGPCPHCGILLPAPVAWHGNPEMGTMHSNRDCPNCGHPLIYFVEGVLAGEWREDEREERERRLRAEDE